MKANQVFQPNKKLILHFDIDAVIRLPVRKNKDLYVYDLCAQWVWGKLQKNSKEDPDMVTGWKLAQNSLSKSQPDPELISYKQYLKEYAKPDADEWEKLILNLSKGPAAKAKGDIQKTIKNITLPKALSQAIKQQKQPKNDLQRYYINDGKYQILPAFYKMFMALKKTKRQFAIYVKSYDPQFKHLQIINQLNLFFTGQHPLYNGQNGTPLVKMDGNNKTKNFIFQDSHFAILYQGSEGQYLASFGTQNFAEQGDMQMLKQRLKSNKRIKFCQDIGQIYSYSHAILGQAAFIYEINQSQTLIIDPVDYLTHEIYFTQKSENKNIISVTGQKLQKVQSFIQQVDAYQLLRDVDYFTKKIESKQQLRAKQIQKIQKGEEQQQQQEQQVKQEQGEQKMKENKANQLSDAEYLKKNIVPVLDAALRQVDLFRPEDPLGFIALYCLKNKQRLQ